MLISQKHDRTKVVSFRGTSDRDSTQTQIHKLPGNQTLGGKSVNCGENENKDEMFC